MKSSWLRARTVLTVASLLFLSFAVSRSVAQTSSDPKTSSDPRTASGLETAAGQEQIRVIGHLPLEGMHVNQMFVQQRNDKVYLFLHRPMKQAYALVDVTKPDKPALLNRETLQGSSGTQVEDTSPGSAFAITITPENSASQDNSAAVSLPTETIQFVDMSNPKSAKSVKTFKSVTSVYPDDSRKLVYLANNEGLWIISHHMTHPLPLCNSESSITPEPDCQ